MNMIESISNLAKQLLLAQSQFNRAYCQLWVNEVKPCADETGWKLLKLLRQEIELFVFKYERGDLGIKHAAWEVFRLQLVGDADYTFEDAMGFVKWYEKLKSKIAQAIGHLYEFHGDTFSDLCDSYPLAGPQLVERALATHPKSKKPRREGFLDEAEVRNTVLEHLGLRWHKLICSGENYVEAALETACKRCYLHRILTGRDAHATWTEEEQSEVSFACHGEEW
jgi:hypothetical protein